MAPKLLRRVGRRAYIAVAVVMLLLLGGAVGAYAWDKSQEDEIAEGVRVGDVDVGGMSASEARSAVRADLIKPLTKPVTVTHDGTRYVLKPDELNIHADIDGMVDDALAAGREEGLPGRLWRYATGGEVEETIQPTVAYSDDAIDTFVGKVAAAIDQNPVDASIEPSPASLNEVPGEPGRTLQADQLRASLEEAVQSPQGRTVQAQVDEVEPQVTREDLASRYPVYLTVDRSNYELRLWENLKLTETYPIAVGAVGWDTPAGVYNIQNKAVDPAWSVPEWGGELAGKVIPGGSPENPLKARWLGIFDGAGIHGTDDVASLGTAASHGCVRMAVPDVIELYDQVPVGTPIYIG
jgi:lipoprotein-anchoring transpeptidase ErfK/SrfK